MTLSRLSTIINKRLTIEGNIPEPFERGIEMIGVLEKVNPTSEALKILNSSKEELPELLDTVYQIRKHYKGNTVSVQLLTNARSGNCTQDCTYCAQSCRSDANIEKYSFVSDEKLRQDSNLIQEKHLTRHCIGLSGMYFNDSQIEALAEQIKMLKEETQKPICCSIGFLTYDQALMLKNAGLDRINHNLNTSRTYYPHICTTHTFEQRVENIKMLQGMGYEICCGGIVGLGESVEDVAEMLLEIQAINPQAVPINFLIPICGTPLERANISHLTPEYCLKVLCLARLLLPQADIRCAGGREIYLKGYEKWMFYAVDSIFASGYLTADGQSIEDTIKIITDAGFEYRIEE